jgi:hypothetical protein
MDQHLADGDWRSIAQQASNEMDSAKLMILVAKLCRALDDVREKKSSPGAAPTGNEPRSFPGDQA